MNTYFPQPTTTKGDRRNYGTSSAATIAFSKSQDGITIEAVALKRTSLRASLSPCQRMRCIDAANVLDTDMAFYVCYYLCPDHALWPVSSILDSEGLTVRAIARIDVPRLRHPNTFSFLSDESTMP